MHILLTGGTGFIGSATLRVLQANGHSVLAAVRSEEAAHTVAQAGATPAIGDLTDASWLGALLNAADGAIHLATDNSGPAFDSAVLDAVIESFGGTGKPYVHTGGVWVWGSGSDLHESDEQDPPAITAWRGPVEDRILSADVRASLVAPAIVYGHGMGIPRVIVDAPRNEDGALHLVGDGSQHWTTVHVEDLAELYVLALEKSPAGETYIGASGVNPTVRELGEAVVGPDGRVVPESLEETRSRLGEAFADALLVDQQATGAKAKDRLGWNPHRPTILEELRGGYAA